METIRVYPMHNVADDNKSKSLECEMRNVHELFSALDDASRQDLWDDIRLGVFSDKGGPAYILHPWYWQDQLGWPLCERPTEADVDQFVKELHDIALDWAKDYHGNQYGVAWAVEEVSRDPVNP